MQMLPPPNGSRDPERDHPHATRLDVPVLPCHFCGTAYAVNDEAVYAAGEITDRQTGETRKALACRRCANRLEFGKFLVETGRVSDYPGGIAVLRERGEEPA